MKNWLTKNLKNIIVTAFVVPILLVAFVSISHVTSFYGLSNPFTWAIYLSVGIEIAALSALAAVSVNMGRFVYLPFFIVTLIQMLGNIFFSFTYIDETGQSFKDWIDMTGGLFETMGVERNDLNSHKTILSFLTGGLLPIISLTFAHMLVKFTEKNQSVVEETNDKVEITTEVENVEEAEPKAEN
jgi:Trk-type K+ transport system membrane component